ncbi:flagellin [Alteribacter keqinensis]|uniref:Flagellin n=1 Tax=Alteribacter keqinensis TaxID=2483800 RepID=A0A3M7TQ75_9BACI|nr:flagellin [Alteribacter keqinensis]RNA67561.1 flagellin [Alteribacter keqinensis]
MIINNNISALNTHRQMGINQQANQSAMEKLSSGLRINRAGDDAAGLAISEKMRAQINGLDQATRNSQDGISMIQTAEGALNETHDILQRMRELAVQSANDTNTDEDRAELQKEVDQLSQEISRIGNNTEFNTQNLLDGTLDNKFHIGANGGQNLSLSIDDMRAEALGVVGVEDANATSFGDFTVTNLTGEAVNIEVVAATDNDNDAVSETTATLNDDGSVTITLAQEAGTATTTGDISATKQDVLDALNSVSGLSAVATDPEEDLTADAESLASEPIAAATFDANKGIDISSQAAADAAITTINDAIESVSAERSKLGAVQNRLEHTINNLGTSAENLQAAESRIRDVDMAAEMMEMTRSNILSQASQSMLAQANQQPQSVLQLLG